MNLQRAKHILYGICAGYSLLMLVMACMADGLGHIIAKSTGEVLGMQIPPFRLSPPTLSIGITALALLTVTIRYNNLLIRPQKAPTYFLVAILALSTSLGLLFANPAQDFDLGFLVPIVALIALAHDGYTCYRRAKHLASINWR